MITSNKGKKRFALLGIGVLSVAGMAGYLFLTPRTASASTKIKSETDVHSESALTVEDRAEVSRAAGEMLSQVYQARLAVANKHKDEALHHVKQALQLSRIIKQVMPKYQVHTKIEAGGIVYDNKDDVQPLLVPLYQELDRVNLLEPLAASRKLSAAHAATTAAQKATDDDDVVASSDVDYFSTTMDVKWATANLWSAKYYLDHGNWKRAEDALRRGENSVSFSFGVATVPLAKASDNIALAKDMIKLGHTAHASQALKNAAATLEGYGKTVTGSRQQEVHQMLTEINQLQQEIASSPKLTAAQKASAVQRTSRWWNKILPWRSNDVCVQKPGAQSSSPQCVAR